MTIKSLFSKNDFEHILSLYQLGTIISYEPISDGTVQTNYLFTTEQGKFVFRYYENRAYLSVMFEIEVLRFLHKEEFPSPVPIPSSKIDYVGTFNNKPYVIFHFLEGASLAKYQDGHQKQLIHLAAQLQKLTVGFQPKHTPYRWNYSPDLCRQLAQEKAVELGTNEAQEKLNWLIKQLKLLELPDALPRAICHCDFHESNVFFQGDKLSALLDFDDANYTYSTFDLVCLIEGWAWHYPEEELDLAKAAEVVALYRQHRSLSPLEQHHFIDVYKLSILIDCLWFFARGSGDDFYEYKKIKYLNSLGREQFKSALFQ